ncbi:MAG: diguanylate cyclase [Nitrosomonas sp.]|nr:diguanylate cyclase [Nitrosomonas sp.]
MKSIKSKIVLFALVATLLPSIGLGLLTFWQNEALVNSGVTRELRALTDNISRQLDGWLSENILAIRALAVANPVVDGLVAPSQPESSDDDRMRAALASYLSSVMDKLDNIAALAVFDLDRQLVARSAMTPEADVALKRWSQALPIDKINNDPSAALPEWEIYYAAATFSIIFPVLSSDNVLKGYLAAALDTDTLASQLRETRKFSLGEIILLDQTGQVFLSSAVQLDHTAKLDPKILTVLRELDRESLIYDGLAYPRAIGLISDYNKFTSILVERDYADVQAAWGELRNRFMTLVVILIGMVTAFALYMGHTIVAPLEKLIAAARGIVDGKLDVHLQIHQHDEIGQLAAMFNQMTDALRHKRAEIMAVNEAIRQKNQLLQKLSVTDGLTGLYNRKKLDAILIDQLARFKRNNRPFCLLMIDIDYFKHVNDELGHIMGDKILVTVSAVLVKSIRTIDYAARYGGDEFMIILVETDIDAASKTAERIRTEASTLCQAFDECPVKITLSVGIAQSRNGDTMPNDLIARADEALYEAKKAGRDQVHIHCDCHIT